MEYHRVSSSNSVYSTHAFRWQKLRFGEDGSCTNQDFHDIDTHYFRFVDVVSWLRCADEWLALHRAIHPRILHFRLYEQYRVGQFVPDDIHHFGFCKPLLLQTAVSHGFADALFGFG